MKMTYQIAMAAGRDAANRQKAAGRTSWDEDDWAVAAAVVAELLGDEA